MTYTSKQPISYEARDGLTIHGYLSLPKESSQANLPTVIYPHWGPEFKDSWHYDYVTQYLTSLGYAVLQMNYRGSTGYGTEFHDLGKHQWGDKMLEDINDGSHWMVREGIADPNRMCILGDTYGGYAALQSVVKDQSLYKCSITHAAITDLETYRNLLQRYLDFTFIMDYIESENYDLEEASPANNIDKINIPVLLLHSNQDTRVKSRQSKSFESKMKSADKDVTYINWKEGNNFLSGQKQRTEFLLETGKFLDKHLKN